MSRPRDRASAEGLLPCMEARPWKDGKTVTYRFHPADGKPINLGTDRAAALQQVLNLSREGVQYGTLEWLWPEYKKGKRWLKLAPGSQADYELAWKQIAPILGRMPAKSITSPMVARYVHVQRADSPRRADIEKTLLSNMFKRGITLGVCDINPTIGVEPHGSEASDVMPDTLVLERFARWVDGQTSQRKVIGLAMRFAALAGSRQIEFLPLTWMQVDEAAGVVRLVRAKQRGKKKDTVVEHVSISPAMRQLLAEIRALGRDCPYLFPTEDNNQYTARGFKTLWQRCVHAAIAAGVITAADRFNFHALRRYYATMHKAAHGALPDLHANPAVTARVYDGTKLVNRKAL